MTKPKNSRLRGATLALAQVQAVYLHWLVFEIKAPAPWFKAPKRDTAKTLDEAGILVKVERDTYNFGRNWPGDAYTCVDVLDQWRIEALEVLESRHSNKAALAEACGMTRQALYRLVWGGSSPQHYFTIRGRSPILLWQGKPLQAEYDRCLPNLEAVGLVGSLA